MTAPESRRWEPRRAPSSTTVGSVTERADDPCDRCGSYRVRITERTTYPPGGRPASMGPVEPHVTIRCARCHHVRDEFDA